LSNHVEAWLLSLSKHVSEPQINLRKSARSAGNNDTLHHRI
jgi:hypothetical protein